jgi:hypothetical protein
LALEEMGLHLVLQTAVKVHLLLLAQLHRLAVVMEQALALRVVQAARGAVQAQAIQQVLVVQVLLGKVMLAAQVLLALKAAAVGALALWAKMELLTLLAAMEGRAFHPQLMEQQLLVVAVAVLVATQAGLAELVVAAEEEVQAPMELLLRQIQEAVAAELNIAPTPQVMEVLAL